MTKAEIELTSLGTNMSKIVPAVIAAAVDATL
jgi:hypothetical protein